MIAVETTVAATPEVLQGPWERIAEQVARRAHGDTRNKHSGELYILHPERVVAYLRRAGADDFRLAIGWLHDVVEDTSITLADLALIFPARIVAAVDALTHRKGERRIDYYARVGAVYDALMVKIADLLDNTDPERRVGLPQATILRLDLKYSIAHRELNPWVIHHLNHREIA